MSNELKAKKYRRGIHTAYVGNSDKGMADAGHATQMVGEMFERGKPRRSMPSENAKLLKGAGLTR